MNGGDDERDNGSNSDSADDNDNDNDSNNDRADNNDSAELLLAGDDIEAFVVQTTAH